VTFTLTAFNPSAADTGNVNMRMVVPDHMQVAVADATGFSCGVNVTLCDPVATNTNRN
jgi:hypothetical protein